MWSGNGTFVPVGLNVKYVYVYQYNQRNRPGRVLLQGLVATTPGLWATYSTPRILFNSKDNINISQASIDQGNFLRLRFNTDGSISYNNSGTANYSSSYTGPTRWIDIVPTKQYEMRIKTGTNYSTGGDAVSWAYGWPNSATIVRVDGVNNNLHLNEYTQWCKLNATYPTGGFFEIFLGSYYPCSQLLTGTIYIREVGTTLEFSRSFSIYSTAYSSV
jgi:hypothetical protein